MSGKYFPNNWEAWSEMPEDFLHAPTWERTMVELKSMSTRSNTLPKTESNN
jgi:hypothetical protein